MFAQATWNYKLLILFMRKSITLLFVLSAFFGKAQIWFDLGAKLGYGPSMSFNKNSFNNLDYSYKYAGAFLYGGKLSVNFNPNHAIVGELLFNQFTHAVNVQGNPNKVNLKYMQIPVMYRNNSDNGGYTEIGVQFNTLNSAQFNGADVTQQFVKSNYDAVLGFGQYIGGGNVFGLNLGLRIAYTLNDVINAAYRTSLGNAVYAPNNAESFSNFKYQATHNVYVAATLELNFDFGYLAKGSNCHKGTRFKMF